MSLYTLDGSTRELLRLANFNTPDFTVKSFVEQLSGAQRHLDEDQRLDPKPYIRTFESAAAELERLHGLALDQEAAAAKNASELAEDRNEHVQDLANQMRECVKEVKALDEAATEAQRTSGPVGQSLERMAFQHQQISDYRLLISTYLSFSEGRQPIELTRLWSQDMRRCAMFVAKLQALASAIGPIEGHSDAQPHIDKFAENLENRLLSNFLDSYQNFDLAGMRESADILTEFNGGGAVTQAYINQHRFFMNLEQLQQNEETPEDVSLLWTELRDYKSSYDKFGTIVDKLVKEIADTIGRETEIITKVFPHPSEVLALFIQRTFAQNIQEIVNKYMEEAAEHPETIAQVRVLGVCYSRVHTLINEIQKVWAANDTALSEAEQAELAAILDSNLLDAFVLYLGYYFDLEKQSLLEIFDSEFQTVSTKYGPGSASNVGGAGSGGMTGSTNSKGLHTGSSGQVAEDGRMDRLKRAMRNLTHDDSDDDVPTTPVTTSSNSMVFDSPKNSDDSPRLRKSRWSRLQNLPVENVQTVLAAFGEAISREQILRSPSDFPSDATSIYNLLSHELGRRYISATIDSATGYCMKIEAKTETDWMFIGSIKTSGHALRLLSAFVKAVLFAMVQNSPQTQQNLAEALNSYILNLQRSCTNLMEMVADVMHSRTAYILGRNSKRDFIDPTEGSVISSELHTDVESLAHTVKLYLSHENGQRIIKLVAMNLCNDILDHMRQYTISIEGGVALGNDVAQLEQLLNEEFMFTNEVADKFATLKAITKLYASDESILSSLLRDSHLSRLPPNQLRTLLSQRADHGNKLKNMLSFNSFA